MDLMDDDFSECGINVDVPLRNTNDEGEKSNKCNQCDFTSFWAGNLRTHLKTHSGEKSNKCKQFDYVSSRKGNTQWRKTKQMQPMRLCILSGGRFEDTLECTQKRKAK